MNKKYKYLSKNFILFGISSFGPKIIAFLMVPLYTNCLSTADYGIGDIVSTFGITNHYPLHRKCNIKILL